MVFGVRVHFILICRWRGGWCIVCLLHRGPIESELACMRVALYDDDCLIGCLMGRKREFCIFEKPEKEELMGEEVSSFWPKGGGGIEVL